MVKARDIILFFAVLIGISYWLGNEAYKVYKKEQSEKVERNEP